MEISNNNNFFREGHIFEMNTDMEYVLTVHQDFLISDGFNKFTFDDNEDEINLDNLSITASYQIKPLLIDEFGDWSEFDSINIIMNLLDHIDPNVSDMFRLRFKFEYKPDVDDLPYLLTCVLINDTLITNDCIEMSILYAENKTVVSQRKNLFDPYKNVELSIQRYRDEVDVVNLMIGIEMAYFKVESIEEEIDQTFKVHKKFKLNKAKYIKGTLPEGEIIDVIAYLSDQYEYEQDVIIHIPIQHFKRAFGEDFAPEANDYVYMKINNKVYDIHAVAYSQEQFMGKKMWWEVALRKHVSRDDIDESPIINNRYGDSNETDFNPELFLQYNAQAIAKNKSHLINDTATIEENHVSQFDSTQFGSEQFITEESTIDYTVTPIIQTEHLRQLADEKLEIIKARLEVGWDMFSGTQYLMSKVSRKKFSVVYQKLVPDTDNTLFFWFNIAQEKLRYDQIIMKYGKYGNIIYKPNTDKTGGTLWFDSIDKSQTLQISTYELKNQNWYCFSIAMEVETKTIKCNLFDRFGNGLDLQILRRFMIEHTHNNVDDTENNLCIYGGKMAITNIRLIDGLLESGEIQEQMLLINYRSGKEVIYDNCKDLPI